VLVAQCGGDLVLEAHPAAAEAGVFRSIVELQAAINCFLTETNADPKSFAWTAHPDRAIAAVRRGIQVLASMH